MGVIDGQAISAAVTNPAFLDANADDTAQGKIDFANTAPESGPTVTNIQRETNSLNSWTGRPSGSDFDDEPTFTNSQGFTAIEDLTSRVDAVSGKFENSLGHSHDGSLGGGAPISAVDLDSVPLKGYVIQGTDILGVTGVDTDVSTIMLGFTASTGITSVGVVVTPPINKLVIRQATGAASNDSFLDAFGNIVYGRVTNSGLLWTLSFYVDLSGVETAYSFSSSSDVRWYFQQLFNPMDNPPTYSEYAVIPSDNATTDVLDATSTQRGVVSVTTQSFSGVKTFLDGLKSSGPTSLDVVDDAVTTGSNASLPSPTKSIVRLTDPGLVSIDRIQGGTNGKLLILINSTGVDITLIHETGSPSGDQISLSGSVDQPVPVNGAVLLAYEPTTQKWLAIGGGSSGVNKTLSNLDSPTAVNQHLNLGGNNITGVTKLDMELGVFTEMTVDDTNGFQLQTADLSTFLYIDNTEVDLYAGTVIDLNVSNPNSVLRLQSVGTNGIVQVNATNGLDMGSKKITSLLAPTAATDAANKAYVDANSGGGAGSLIWLDDAGAAPLASWDGFRRVVAFLFGDTQELNTTVRVPQSYTAGKPINLRTEFYSGDASGTVLIQATARLFRPGTSDRLTPLGTRVTTNAAVTMTGGNQNQLIALTLDLSDSGGLIGGQAVAAGDEICIELTRTTDTATGDANVAIFTGEVTFK